MPQSVTADRDAQPLIAADGPPALCQFKPCHGPPQTNTLYPFWHWSLTRANFVAFAEVTMGVSVKTLGIDRLNVDERLALVEEIWASICVDAKAFPLTEQQRAELDRRVAEDDAFPDDVIPWDDIKASARARLAR